MKKFLILILIFSTFLCFANVKVDKEKSNAPVKIESVFKTDGIFNSQIKEISSIDIFKSDLFVIQNRITDNTFLYCSGKAKNLILLTKQFYPEKYLNVAYIKEKPKPLFLPESTKFLKGSLIL